MRRPAAALLALALAAPGAAGAAGRLVVDGRLGVARPFGDLEGSRPLGDVVRWAFPLEAQLRLRALPRLSAGLYGRVAPALLAARFSSTCPQCAFADFGAGLAAEVRLGAAPAAGPWAGAALGWAFLRGSAPGNTQLLSGPEAALSGGWDLEAPPLAVGPWAALRLARFTRSSFDGEGLHLSRSVEARTVHGWAAVGVRARVAF